MRLPACLDDTWDQTAIGHLAEAKTGKLEFFQNTADTSCDLAATAKAYRRGIARHFVQCHLRSVTFLFALIHVENDLFQTLTLVPLQFNKALAFFLFCNPGF